MTEKPLHQTIPSANFTDTAPLKATVSVGFDQAGMLHEPTSQPPSSWTLSETGEQPNGDLATSTVEGVSQSEGNYPQQKHLDKQVALGQLATGNTDEAKQTWGAPTEKGHATLAEAYAAERDRYKAALKQAQEQDKKTELLNQDGFVGKLQELLDSGETDIAVLFLDLEGFKQVNDKLGHEAGDLLIKKFADQIRSEDIAARLGGDEFAVAIQGYKRNARKEMSDIERSARTKYRFRQAAQGAGAALGAELNTSLGMVLAKEGSTAEQLLKEADAAMYEDKRARKQKPGPLKRIVSKLRRR